MRNTWVSAALFLLCCVLFCGCAVTLSSPHAAQSTPEETASDTPAKDGRSVVITADLQEIRGGRLICKKVERVEETDLKRIRELESLGVEPSFPNGYYLYCPDTEPLAYPVAADVAVFLFNANASALTDSNLGILCSRLDAHTGDSGELFLCSLRLEGGKVTEIAQQSAPACVPHP